MKQLAKETRIKLEPLSLGLLSGTYQKEAGNALLFYFLNEDDNYQQLHLDQSGGRCLS